MKNTQFSFSTTPSSYPKSLLIYYLYISNSPDHNADILATYLS